MEKPDHGEQGKSPSTEKQHTKRCAKDTPPPTDDVQRMVMRPMPPWPETRSFVGFAKSNFLGTPHLSISQTR